MPQLSLAVKPYGLPQVVPPTRMTSTPTPRRPLTMASLAEQVTVIFAGTNGFADQVPADKMAQWQRDLTRYLEASYPEIGKALTEKKMITDEIREQLMKALDSFRAGWQAA